MSAQDLQCIARERRIATVVGIGTKAEQNLI